jgi:hypothetical protein
MNQVEYTIILILCHFNYKNLMIIPTESIDNCMIYTDEYWYVYQTHFLLVNFLTLQVLQTDNHIFELNKFTQTAIEVMNSYDYFIAIKIEENFLNQGVNPSEPRFYNTTIRHGTVSDFNPITDEQLFNIKTY